MDGIFRWSSCQADYISSSDSSTSEDEEETFEEIEVIDDFGAPYSYSCRKKRYTTVEMLDVLEDNDGDTGRTVDAILQELTSSSLNHLNSQKENEKKKKRKNLIRKIERVKAKFSKNSRLRNIKEGEKDFISESQDSFVKGFHNESNEETNEDFEEERNGEPEKTIYRRPLNKLKDKATIKERTNSVFEVINNEAEKQQISPTELLAYLIYRENYIENRNFALSMHKIFINGYDDSKSRDLPAMKAIAICSRGKFGRTTYNYVRRSLKPLEESWQKSFNCKYLM